MMASPKLASFKDERSLFSTGTVWSTFTLLVILTAAASCLSAQQSQFRTAFNEFVHVDGTVGASFVVLDRGRITDSGQRRHDAFAPFASAIPSGASAGKAG